MLTHDDMTVANAAQIFEQCKDSKAKYWGFKEKPLPTAEMKALLAEMKRCGKTTFLEVVEYTEAEGLAGACVAAECGCDILMGTCFSDKINDFCRAHNMKYMPFVGKITGRPSVLEGEIDEMIAEAREYLAKGVHGFDLLGYRYTGDAARLNSLFVKNIEAPVCLAGSVDSYQRLDEIKAANPWAFTIGSAFFEGKFGKSFSQQINNVIDYMANDKNTKNEVVEYYDSIAKTYDESRFNNTYGRFIDAQERKVLDKLIDTAADGARLDMACGTGRLTNYATHGLDASAEMMASAQERHPAVEFRQASACDTGFEADSFDVVYSFHLLMHLDHDTIAKIFDEMGRIIKPGGRFVFDIPSSRRRNMLGHKQATWHGKYEMDTAAAMAFAAGKFELRRRFGIMMLPVHKLPVWMRKGLVKFDYLLANSFLREYSSYLVFEFVKK